MVKDIYFFVSHPRSGGTLLSNILDQNPYVHVASSTAMYEVITSARNAWHDTGTMQMHPIPEQLTNITNALVESMWDHRNEPIIIDRNREWGKNLTESKEIFGKEIKVISTVRDLPSIMASWVVLSGTSDIEVFCDEIWNKFVKDTMISVSYVKQYHNSLLIDYDDLVTDPQGQLDTITKFLELPKFKYNFKNVPNPFGEKNIVPWGFDNMHNVRPKVQKISKPAYEVLGDKLFQKYEQLEKDY
jgi:hypothetical protein